jgi:hypothetical protein
MDKFLTLKGKLEMLNMTLNLKKNVNEKSSKNKSSKD